MRVSKWLVGLVVLAVLTFLPGGLRAQTSPDPVAEVSGGNATLTPVLLEKMLKLIAAKGQDRECPAVFANALGLSETGKTWADRQMSAGGKTTGFLYGFAVSRGSDHDVFLTVRRRADLLGFRARRDGTLVSAFAFKADSKELAMRPVAKAQDDFAEVCAFWKANADKLMQ